MENNNTADKEPTMHLPHRGGYVWQYRGKGWKSQKPCQFAAFYKLNLLLITQPGCDVSTEGHVDVDYWESVPMAVQATPSPTPRTDAAWADMSVNVRKHAEGLERELLEMTDIAEGYRTELDATRGIVEALEEEVAKLKAWKSEAIISCQLGMDIQEIGTELGMPLGMDIRPNILTFIKKLKMERNNWENLAVENAKLIQACYMAIAEPDPMEADGTTKRLESGWGMPVTEPDYAQQARQTLAGIFQDPDLDTIKIATFVDLIIKAAKQ